jgi:gliding motility-associated-like protein
MSFLSTFLARVAGGTPFFCHRAILPVLLLGVSFHLNGQSCGPLGTFFLPTVDQARFEAFGTSLAADGDYLVAAAPENSSRQVYSGLAYVYKLNAQNKWDKIAELMPSDPEKYQHFGRRVAISGNTIIVSGVEHNDDAWSRTKLYVFKRPTAGEWTTTTEDYIIAKPTFGTILSTNTIGTFALHGNEMIAVASNNGVSALEVYREVAGRFTLVQSLPNPKDRNGIGRAWDLVLSDTFFAIGHDQFVNADRSSGVVFIYEKIAPGSFKTSPAILTSSEQTSNNFTGFGSSIATNGSTLVVKGARNLPDDSRQLLYIFEKPATGWVSTKALFMLESRAQILYQSPLAMNDEYIMSAGLGYQSVIGYKKPAGGWDATATPFIIDDLPTNTFQVGNPIVLTTNHLILGCPAKPLKSGIADEAIADYYAPTGRWEDPALAYQQLIHEPHTYATDDNFGQDFAVYGDQIAITAAGDDEHGINTGIVYIFNTEDEDTPKQRIDSPEDENNSGFGRALAVGDSVLLIGAPYQDSINVDGTRTFSIGKVYVYRRTDDGWKYSSQIVAPVMRSEMEFGQSVVWSKGYCAVMDRNSGSSSALGHVHVYKENPITKRFDYLATLSPAEPVGGDQFGRSMVMQDSILVIGTGGPSGTLTFRRSVYIFLKNGEWTSTTEDARLINSDAGVTDYFGISVSMSGDYIVVGAPNSPGYTQGTDPILYPTPGAAYVYKKPAGGWKGTLTEIARLSQSDPIPTSAFGRNVVIDRQDVFVADAGDYIQYNVNANFTNHDNRFRPGKIYHYVKPSGGEWRTIQQEDRQIISLDPEFLDAFGCSLYMDDRTLYVGAMLDDTESGFRSGSVQKRIQSPAVEAPSIVCGNDAGTVLLGHPRGGQWSGPGVDAASSMFYPAAVGQGVHSLRYNYNGCEVVTNIEVVDAQFNIRQQSDALQTKCIGTSLPVALISDKAASDYQWYYRETPGATTTKLNLANQTITIQRPGEYEVVINRGVCPAWHERFRIADEAPIEIDITALSTLCDGQDVQLQASPAAGTWHGTQITPKGQFTAAGLANGAYTLRYDYITALGCPWKDSTTVYIDKLELPVLQASGRVICGDTPVTLNISPVDDHSTVTWYHNGSVQSDWTKATTQASKPGIYTAVVSKADCSLDTDPMTVNTVTDSLFVPNVFTANGDAINDFFEVQWTGLDNFHMSIVNRYGQMMFETNNPSFQWAAEHAPTGVYFWRATYTSCANIPKDLKGWVHVLKP